ncbi:MAG: delta-60 repeat domain-containing protein [Flavobacteriales bacterium]|nr:MAG: delta-60 repeat domain-containing protein [Flavobacteriales bacterium]
MKPMRIAILTTFALFSGSLCAQYLTLDSTLWQLDSAGKCVVEDSISDRILVGGAFNRVLPPDPVPYGLEVSTTNGLKASGLPAADSTVRCAIADEAGGWIIGGAFTTVDGQPRQHLARILADGSLAPWAPVVNGEVLALALKGDTLYLGGQFSTVNSAARNNLAAVRLSTGANVTWAAGTSNGTVHCMSLNSGRLYVGGDFTTVNGLTRGRGASFTVSNHALTNWTPNTNGTVHCIVATSTVVYVGGAFTLVNLLTARNRIAAFPPTSNTPQAWNPNANGTVRAMALSGTNVFFGGDFTTVSATARNHIAFVNASGVLQSWSRDLNGDVHCLAVANNTVFAGGDFTLVDGLGRRRMAAFGVPSSGLPTVTDWTAAADSTVMAITAQGTRLFIGGPFVEGGGLSRRNLAALDLVTGLPLPWAPQVNGPVHSIVRAGSGAVFVAGPFTQVGGLTRFAVAAIDPLTADALPWNAQVSSSGVVQDLLARPDTLFVCGQFNAIGGQARQHLALLSATTGAALPWNVPLAAADEPHDMLLSNDTLFICGAITMVAAQARNAVASIGVSSSTVLPFTADCTTGSSASGMSKSGNKLFLTKAYGTWAGQSAGYDIRVLHAATGAVLSVFANYDPTTLTVRGDKVYDSGHYLRAYGAATGMLVGSVGEWHNKGGEVITTRSGDVIGVGYVYDRQMPMGLARAIATPNITLRAMLDGPFEAGLMNDQLRADQLIPFTEPFTSLGYIHTGGGGGEAAPAGFHNLTFDGTPNTRPVDWVLIEFRDAADPSVVVASRSGFLLKDGRILGPDMRYLRSHSSDPSGSYYVAVRHRNHLGVMTGQPVDFSKSPFIDFSVLATPVFGNNARKTNNGVQTLWSGDVNFDGTIKYTGTNNDRDPVLVRIGGSVPTNTANGYYNEDVNMDGVVKYTGLVNDRDPILVNIGGTVPTNARVEQVP